MPAGRRNLTTLLDDLAREPARAAFVLETPYRTFRFTAGRVRSGALALAERLRASGVRPGDRVLLQGPDGPDWCAAFLGVVACGAVVVPLDVGAPPRMSRAIAAKVDAAAAVVAPAGFPVLRARVRIVERLEDVLRAGESGREIPEPHRASPGDTAEIAFTSGTTADPRGVELSHANLLHSLERIETGFRKRERWLKPLLPMRLLCLVPLSHLFGQSLGLFLPVIMRSTGVFLTSSRPSRILAVIRDEHPIAVITVPRSLASLRDAALREMDRRGRLGRFERAFERTSGRRVWRRILATRDLRAVTGWRTWAIVVGGAPLPQEVETFWSRCGFAVIQGYGMTEAAPIVTVHNPLSGRRHTLGRPVGGVEVRLADDGEILVRGPNVMKGYFDDPAATREAMPEGWLRTGDLAERADDGRLVFRGRKKDVIVTPGGMNVFPGDVERVLEDLDGVREAVVFAVPGPSGDEVHAAVLGDVAVTPEGLRSEANRRLISHQRLRSVFVWSGHDFPRTATGKVRRRDVAAVAAAKSREGRQPPTEDSRVARVLAQVRDDRSRGLDPRLRLSEDLGLESLDIVDLLGRIEEEYDVSLDDRAVGTTLTVGDVERLVTADGDRVVDVRMPRWSRRLPARWVRRAARLLVVRTSFSLFVRLRVEGVSLHDLELPCIFVANHTSVLDAPAVTLALPGRAGGRVCPAMAIETLPEHFDPAGKSLGRRLRASLLYKLAVLLFNAYPLPQTRGFRPSLEYTGELLDAGFCPLVFPEGRMTRTGDVQPFKSGVGLLALETRAPLVPIYLDGLARVLPPGARWPRRGPARVIVGEPLAGHRDSARDPAGIAAEAEAAVRALRPDAPDGA